MAQALAAAAAGGRGLESVQATKTSVPHPRATVRLLALTLLAACAQQRPEPAPLPWERVDLWSTKPVVETPPPGSRWLRASTQTISFLGTAEVRDMTKIPPSQLVAFPRRTAGQVRALAQVAGSRLRWRVALGAEPYLSFVPLGTEAGCACTYRVTVRPVADGGERGAAERELWRRPVTPVAPIAPAAVELPLAPWASRPVDLLFEVRPLGPLPAAAAGAPPPAALWGSPAVYGRKALPPPPAPGAPRQINPAAPNILLIGLDTLRADALGPWRQGAPA